MADEQQKDVKPAPSEGKLGKKARKKKWFTIIADSLFSDAELGECLVYGITDLNKRIVSANLMTLTNDVKQQNVTVRFQVHTIKGDVAVASMVSYEMMPASIKRMVRKEVERIDASFVAMTKDNVKVRIKPLLLAKTATTKSRSRLLRRMAMEFIVSTVNKSTYEELLRLVLGKSLQAHLRQYLKKVYPMKACEIRSLYIATRGTPLVLSGGKIELPVEEKDQPGDGQPVEEAKEEAPQEAAAN